MAHPVQIFLNNLLDSGEKKRTVTALNYFDYYGERFIQIEREYGHRDATIPVFDFDTLDDIRMRIISHPAYY